MEKDLSSQGGQSGLPEQQPHPKWWYFGYYIMHLFPYAVISIRRLFKSKKKQINVDITETIEIDEADGSKLRSHREIKFGYNRED